MEQRLIITLYWQQNKWRSEYLMKISVIIPIFNTQKYLERCIESVIKQKFNDIEIICINDCSEDNSQKIIESYQRIDERIIVINNPINLGLSECRNIGIENSHGDYIMFLDSDDCFIDNAFEDLQKKIGILDLDILFFGFKECLLEDKNSKNVTRVELLPKTMDGKEFFCNCQKKKKEIVTSWSAIYKRQFLVENELKFVKGLLHEDVLFYFEILMKAKRVSSTDMCCYEYIRRKGSITISDDNIQAKTWSLSKIAYRISMYNQFVDDKIKYYINNYVGDRFKTIFENYNKIEYFDFNKYDLEPEVDFAMKIVGATHYNGFFTYKLPRSIISEIRKYNKVIIYGAGNVGQGLCELLKEYHINPNLFVQTTCNISNMRMEPYNIEVKSIEAVKERQDTIILVAVKNNSGIMVEKAKDLGFQKVLDMVKYI